MNKRQKKSIIAGSLIAGAALLASLPLANAAGLLGMLGVTSPTSATSGSGLIGQVTTAVTSTVNSTVGGLLGQVTGSLGGSLDSLDPGLVVKLLDNQADTVLFTLDAGGVTKSYISLGGKLLNTADPLLKPLTDALLKSGRTVTRLAMPTTTEAGALANIPADLIVNKLTPSLAIQAISAVNSVTGGQVKALIPMPLDPKKSCESCHQNKANMILAMTDVVNNLKYPGLAADVAFVDNFYVAPNYTTLADSMMTKAAKHPLWEGCVTCHSTGASFDPFPSDNWVPRSNPNDGPEASKAFGSTNDTSKTCGKCHAANSALFNKGIMGTHRGHLWAFNYNDVEIEGTNAESNFFYDPLGSTQAGTDLNRLPLDRNCKRMNAGYFQSRGSCSTCHQSCSDCHMTGPGNSPTGTLGALNIVKIDPLSALVEIVNVDKTHTTEMVRVKALEGSALRRGGVSVMEMRKGYKAGISRGIPFSVYETGMDVATHKMHKPTTAEQGNTLAPQSQQQSIDFCWRCHFRTGAEFQGNWINVVPNVNYEKSSLGHLNAGMTCTDCHKWSEMHGATSQDSLSFAGTTDAVDNPSHPGGNPIGSTPAWDKTPNPIKTTCGLCHTTAGKALGETGGLNFGTLVTPRYQTIAKIVKGLDMMPVPGKVSLMSHKNIKCEACHTQAQQNCWNCHLEKSESATGLPLVGTNDFSVDALLPIVNVREAEGEPALTFEENALLKEMPSQDEAASLSLALTFPTSPNTVNKSVRFLGRNNKGQVESVVHCPGGPPGINNPNKDPQMMNLDGGKYLTKEGAYGEVGSVQDAKTAAEGSWYMEAGHSIARNPDGIGYEACFNCHADTVRLGQDPITYYRKNPWVMKSIGAPEALMPGSHYADNRHINPAGGFNCSCHSTTGLVHNGTTDGPWPLDILPEAGEVPPTPPTGPDGAALYGSNCAMCHAPLATSTKAGATFDRIKWGIVNLPVMQSLSHLSDEAIHAIAKALGGE
jgi:mono/diheme cytochrome c family protein